MLQKTNKLFIGKDINRTALVVDGIGTRPLTDATYLADGEIVVLDKYKCVLAAGKTIADTDVIFICQGLGSTFSYARPDGTAVLLSRKVRMSDPIQGANVKSYIGSSYTAKHEKVITFVLGATVTVSTEYLLRIVYKDMPEHPGQFTATYRHTPLVNTLATFLTNLTAKVNSHAGRRVQASCTGTDLILTGLPIPECTTGLTDIDKFTMVEFDAFLDYVDSDGNWAQVTAVTAPTLTSKTITFATTYGVGTWESVRDLEKDCWGYLGVTNHRAFPVHLPDACTIVGETYDIIQITHDCDYLSPDNQYEKQTPLLTTIAFAVPGTGTQETVVLGVLNDWLASCPGAFTAVAV